MGNSGRSGNGPPVRFHFLSEGFDSKNHREHEPDEEDKQVLSIEAQLHDLREFAERERLTILGELIEKQSAKIPGLGASADCFVFRG